MDARRLFKAIFARFGAEPPASDAGSGDPPDGAPGAATVVAEVVYGAAVEPLPVLLAAAVALGAVAIPGIDAVLRPNAIAAHGHSVIAYAVTRELIPLVVIAAIALRSGTALAIAIGLGLRARLLPRIAGLALASMGLGVVLSAACLVGGYLVADVAGLLPPGVRLAAILGEIAPATVAVALGKVGLAGALVGLVSAFHGVRAQRAPRDVRDVPSAGARAALQGGLGGLALSLSLSFYPLLAPA